MRAGVKWEGRTGQTLFTGDFRPAKYRHASSMIRDLGSVMDITYYWDIQPETYKTSHRNSFPTHFIYIRIIYLHYVHVLLLTLWAHSEGKRCNKRRTKRSNINEKPQSTKSARTQGPFRAALIVLPVRALKRVLLRYYSHPYWYSNMSHKELTSRLK